MRGQQPLVEMRRQGARPEMVFIDTDAPEQALPWWAQWQECQPGLCEIDVTKSDPLNRLDFRALVGLNVYVHGMDPKRVRVVAASVIEAKAKRVIAACMKRIEYGGEIAFQTLWVEDTAAQFTPEEIHGASLA